MTPDRVRRIYIVLTLLQTLAASLIWGINTLFLLDAGLSLTEAFIANAAFTAGMMVFEVPTGVVADSWGRRASYLLGAATLLVTTMAYLGLWYWGASMWWWALVSALIGLGFTFFSGATEAWLVDALEATGFEGSMETVFGRGQTAVGAATLVGAVAGGFLGTLSLAIPYLVRSGLLLVVLVAAYLWMHDLGFEPVRGRSIREEAAGILRASIEHGWRNKPVRLFMLGAPFASGVGIWAFYAYQPYLLDLLGRPEAAWVAGLASALFAVAQMVGGAAVTLVRRLFTRRTSVIITETLVTVAALVVIGLSSLMPVPVGFWVALSALAVSSVAWAVSGPLQQAYLNDVIPSRQRATVLSFNSLMGSAGGVVIQPTLGWVGDAFSMGTGYAVGGVVYGLRLPFVLAVRRLRLRADLVADPLDARAG